jgi:predicted RNase H-like HicB family nuclease
MKQFTAIIHQGEPDEGGFWATCLEVPGANGQGETKDECLRNLAEAVQLLLDTDGRKPSGSIPRQRRLNFCSHETPGVARSSSGTWLHVCARRKQSFDLEQPKHRPQGIPSPP